jgi:hypothetical protein
VELDHQLSSHLSWVRQIKENDIRHIFHVLQRNQKQPAPPNQQPSSVARQPLSIPTNMASLLQTSITKFNSVWTPHLSAESFDILVKNNNLNSLILSGTQIADPKTFEKLPILAEHFKELTEFIIKNCGTYCEGS